MRLPVRIVTIVLLLLGLAALLCRVAWVGDDALITLRTVYHWSLGYGPVWNVAERVQTYTHPLWMLLLALAHVLSGEFFYGTIVLSLVTALLAALVLMLSARTALAAIAVAALLVGSNGFVNFATSGLENPLTYLLLAALAAIVGAEPGPRSPERRLALAAWITGFALITRMDLLLLCAPAVLVCMRGMPLASSLWRAAAGATPFVLWSLFAALYYGSALPITAYAKLQTGIPTGALLEQGLHYVVYTAKYDPLTLATILVGIGVGLLRKELRCRALALGALLYCGYILKVGGDFMATRFASVPFVMCTAILARALGRWSPRWSLGVAGAALALACVPGVPQWLLPPSADLPPSDPMARSAQENGIADERCFYYDQLGMLSPTLELPEPGALTVALRQLGRTTPVIWTEGQVGRKGFEAGELVHVVDPWLCDPLLMRLPMGSGRWRIGHFVRDMPTGYLETLARGENVIHHPGLARYYEALRTVIRRPVFDRERLATMWRLWTGEYDDGLRAYVESEYRAPPRLHCTASELADHVDDSGPLPALWFDDPRARLVYRGGLEIAFAAPRRAARMHVWLQGDEDYRFTFLRGGAVVGEVVIDTDLLIAMGLRRHSADIPAAIGEFDAIRVDVEKLDSHDVAAVGGLAFEP